ncbi:MAG: amino acid adenylation domain-containing protein, partial [Ktedonobacteraceae bacterium]
FPAERMAYMLQDAQVALLLTHERLCERLPVVEGVSLLELDRQWGLIAQQPKGPVQSGVTGAHLAYIMYTSGSTGKPKGVLIPHQGLLNYLLWCVDAYTARQGRGAPVQSSIAADAIFPSLFAPLLVGTSVLILPQAEPLEELRAQLQEQGGFSLIKITPSQLEVLTQQLPVQDVQGWVSTLVVGAEALRGDVLDYWQEHVSGTVILNEYGPTETVVGCSIYQVPAGARIRGAVPIGLPIANTQFYVLDAWLQPVPIGVIGELYIGGDGVAWGYLNRPALTASVFVPDPFSSQPGARLYKTGDLVRQLAERAANIEFIGRGDQQVKIRGYRVELGEVEARLVEHEGVKSAVVVAREGAGGKQLVAYVMKEPGREPSVSELREYLQERLPAYMIPAAFLVLETLPLTSTGKVDLRALPNPDRQTYELPTIFVAPSTSTEHTLATIWQQVLGLPEVGIYDNFFESGGDSILAIQIMARANEAGLHLSAKHLFDHPTIAELVAVVDQMDYTSSLVAEQGLVLGAVPLTPIQHWFFEQQQSDPQHYNQAVLLEVRQPLERNVLEQALCEILRHHDALRARFTHDESGWHQSYVSPDDTFSVDSIDFSHLSPEAVPTTLEEVANRMQTSLNLQTGPLLYVGLITGIQGQSQRLLLVVHHLVVDGISWRILLEDLHTAYQQASNGASLVLPAKTTSFQHWAERLREYAQSADVREERPYWQRVAKVPVAPLPIDWQRGENTVASARTVSVALTTTETQALLQQVPAAYHTQINDLLLTALVQTIAEWTGTPTMRLTLEGHGREEVIDGIDLSRTLGWFTTQFPVYLQLNTAEVADPAAALKGVKEQLRHIPQRGLGYGVLRYLASEGDVSSTLGEVSEPQLSFNYLGQFDHLESEMSLFKLAHEAHGQTESSRHRRPSLLDINASVLRGSLVLDWTYSNALYRAATVKHLAACYLAYLRELIQHCLSPEAGGYTPSDFPQTQLTQKQVDRIVNGRKDIEDIYPLSPMQHGMLFHSLYDPAFDIYYCQGSWTIRGPIDISAFRHAWHQVIARHPILRTTFAWIGLDQPLQIVSRETMASLEYLDWCEMPTHEQQENLATFLSADQVRGFQLSEAPLMRLSLIHLDHDSYRFVWSYHHILLDGWSVPLVLKDVMTCYQAVQQQQPPQWISSSPYKNYITWLAEQDLRVAETFWRQELRGFTTATSLNIDRPQASANEVQEQYAEQSWQMSARLQTDLQRLAQSYKVTLNTILQGAWALLLSRYNGEQDVVFGVTVSGRPETLTGMGTIVGLFINTLPVRISVSSEAYIGHWLQQVQAHQVEARQYAYTPLWHIQQWSEMTGQQPLFESLFVFENYPLDIAQEVLGELTIENVAQIEQTNYPLSLAVIPGAECLLKLGYHPQRFDKLAITRLFKHYQTLLEGIVAQPKQRIADLSLLTQEEYHTQLVKWNETGIDYTHESYLPALIEAQVACTPNAVALVYQDALTSEKKSLTYAELNRQADILADVLQKEYHVGPGKVIGICIERSVEMVIGLLGILKSGGAYLPLDPVYPEERLAFMLTDSGASVLLTQADLLSHFPDEQLQIICLPLPARKVQNVTRPVLWPEQLAYVIYTSGSTGKPKGTMITHHALRNFALSMQTSPGLTSKDVILAVTSLSFDIAVLELLVPLTVGAQIHLASREVASDASSLVTAIERIQPTLMQTTPARWQMLLAIGWAGSAGLKILCGGEALSLDLAQKLRVRGASLWNMYGPTETTIWSAICPITEETQHVSIGHPIDNTQLYVLDTRLQPVPVGVVGDLYIVGDGLASGYLGRPDLTAERFIPNPFGVAGTRLYVTGDVACYLADGCIDYRGRSDHQVKLRGFRIELGEIEAVLRQHPVVRECLVMALEDSRGDKRLVAYVIPVAEEIPSHSEFRNYLATQLPDYMIPATFVPLSSWPMTVSGKVDRRALPLPDYGRPNLQTTFVAPRTSMERALAVIWQEVLGLQHVGIYDNFFESGGHSLLSLQLISQIQEQLGQQVSLSIVFQEPTIEAMARLLSNNQEEARPWSALVAIQPHGSRPPFFCVHPAPGNVFCYADLAQALGPEQPFYGLQARGIDGHVTPLTTVEEMADLYIQEMRAVQPDGPYMLGGHSFGSLVAFEMAQQLQQQGIEVALLAILDMPAPVLKRSTSPIIINEREETAQLLCDGIALLARLSQKEVTLPYEMLQRMEPADQLEYARCWMHTSGFMLDTGDIKPLQGFLQVHKANNRASEAYVPREHEGHGHVIVLISEQVLSTDFDADQRALYADASLGWGALVPQAVQAYKVPGDHVSMLVSPQVQRVAEHLIHHLDQAQGKINL